MRASFAKRPAQEDQLSVEDVSENDGSKEDDSECNSLEDQEEEEDEESSYDYPSNLDDNEDQMPSSSEEND